jgi:ABC-type uncharacterized transport system substrate-binding protein
MSDMRRREFITVLGGAAAWPLAARAQQQPGMPVIGLVGSESPDRLANFVRAYHQGLSEIGYVEGKNVAIEYRWAEGQNDRLPALVADLVSRQVTVLAAAGSTLAALAAKAATTTIPIVFVTGVDPIQSGLVARLNRPGGNVTGVSTLNVEVGPKRLEFLLELIPAATSIALLINPTNAAVAESLSRGVQAVARSLGINLHVLHASSERDFDVVFAAATQANGLIIGSDIFFNSRIEQLAALTVYHALPAIYQLREFAAAGGLLSYGGDTHDAFRQAGIYTGRILKGEKPAALPVQQATKVQLFINLKTAKALGLKVPRTLIARADEVIE